jgi:histidine triad (HIT) family protein
MSRASCVFCQRVDGGEFDYYDNWCVAFQPLNPVTSAATSPTSAAHAMRFAAVCARDMGLDDFNLITSAGSWATQTVFHLHVHVVPRREGDGLHLPWTGQVKP